MSNLINLGLSGLNAAQWGLTTTGQNISNASTPGYTIETPVFAQTGGKYTVRASCRRASRPSPSRVNTASI